MNRKLIIPAWLLGGAIFAQCLMLLLNVKLIWDQTHQPPSWSLDSTTYYKFLEGQGKLNLRLYEQQQSHEARLRTLDKKRQTRYRHIDSLSGDALQSEIDRQYNNRTGRQHPSGSGSGPDHSGQTDSAHRGRGPSGAQRQSRPTNAPGSDRLSRYVIGSAEAGFSGSEPDDYTAQPAAAGKRQLNRAGAGPIGQDIPPTARSQVGKLAGSGERGGVHSRQTETNLGYWQRIRAQGFIYPDVAWAISAVETGYWWTPPAGHNLFGFRKNKRHFNSGVSAGGYCLYISEKQSLADYGAYEQAVIVKYKLRSRGDYLQHIHRRYCPSPNYPGKLVLAFQELKRLKALA